MSGALITGIALLALAGCGRQSRVPDEPGRGDMIIAGEEKSAQANGEEQAQAAVAMAQSRTLEARVERLEAEVDELKAEATTTSSLKSALADIGESAAAPQAMPSPPPPSRAATTHAAPSAPPPPAPALPYAVATPPAAPPAKRSPVQTAAAAPARTPARGLSPAARLQAQLAPNGVLQKPHQPKLGYDGL